MAYFKLLILSAVFTVFGAAFFLFGNPRDVAVVNSPDAPAELAVALPEVSAADTATSSLLAASSTRPGDVPRQSRLAEPPQLVKGIYLTGWVAGSRTRMNSVRKLLADTELNSVVIDIKDYSGFVSYRTGLDEVEASGAEREPRIIYPNRLLEELHEDGIYVIARLTVFQDPILSGWKPEWAIHDSNGGLWKDRKGLSWMDPAAREVWDYNIAIAKDALDRGFDEVNFDYIRFPSDGPLDAARYPRWDELRPREEVIREFFEYLRNALPGARISADLFGLATISRDDLGIGQKIEGAYPYFDAVMPMVYPSHYSYGFLGYKNPAQYPYEVVRNSLESALVRREQQAASSSAALGKLRPWLQSFDLGAVYDAGMIAAEIRAVDDALGSSGANGGWVLWDPKNSYANYRD